MKRMLCSMIFALLMLFSSTNCLAAEQETYLIHKNQTFDDHKVGEVPGAFVWHKYYASTFDEATWEAEGFHTENGEIADGHKNSKVVKIERNGNSENLAVKFTADDDGDGYKAVARSIFSYYPIKENGVISFSFRADNVQNQKLIKINRNVVLSRHVSWVDNNNYFNFIKISGGNVYFNTTLLGSISANTWYDIDFAFDIKGGTGTVTLNNGSPVSVSLPSGTVNISEVMFELPTVTGDALYIDDLRIYEADEVVADAVIDQAWKKFTDSAFYFGYEFEASRSANYDYMSFLKCDGKKFSIVGTKRFFDGSDLIDLPAEIYYQDDVIIAPVRAVAEALGAEVEWDESTGNVSIIYNERTMVVTPNAYAYHIDGKPAKLLKPVTMVNDSACMQLNVLLNFVDKEYTIQKDILWFDEPAEFNWHMPTDTETGKEMLGSSETSIEDNIYQRILNAFLFDRPSDKEIDEAISTVHPRIEFTSDLVAEIKANMSTDADLASAVNKLKKTASNTLNKPLVERELHDGKRAAYNNTIYEYFRNLAFGYLMADSKTDKDAYKADILRHLNHLDTFPSFHIESNSGLGAGTAAYGFAYIYDWVDWSHDERAMIEDMCKRNIFDHALHAYNCTMKYWHHAMSYSRGNMATITNGGILLLAVSMYESDPEYFQDVIRAALRETEGGTIMYFPDGEYSEGISYWEYAADYLPRMTKGLQTAMGTDFGITDVPGVLETGDFPLRMRGTTGKAYAYGDADPKEAIDALMMFCADQDDNKALAEYRKQNGATVSPSTVDVSNWVYDTDSYNLGLTAYDLDIYNKVNSTVIMKNGWGTSDTAVAFHGGANNDGHGHMDIGSFQLDMCGARFATDLPRENYNLRDLGAYDAAKAPANYSFTANHYYRQKGEGHNTVVANRSVANKKASTDPASYDMKPTGTSKFTKVEFGDDISYAVLNMTDTNDIFECAIRGIKIDKANNIVEIQDDFKASEETDFLWSMHTNALIKIEDSGKSAKLTLNGYTIMATIVNDCDLTFAVSLAEFDDTYGTSVKPPLETPNITCDGATCVEHAGNCSNKDVYRKLYVQTPVGANVEHFRLSIVFREYRDDLEPVTYVPMETWGNN